jgi:hypothetical protein
MRVSMADDSLFAGTLIGKIAAAAVPPINFVTSRRVIWVGLFPGHLARNRDVSNYGPQQEIPRLRSE